MPFVLLFAGILLIAVAVRNQQTAFVYLVRGDFSGPGNFMYWVVAVVLIGAIGYIPKAKPVSNLFLVLLLIVLVLTKGNSRGAHIGVFQGLTNALGGMNAGQGSTSVLGTTVSAGTGISVTTPGVITV